MGGRRGGDGGEGGKQVTESLSDVIEDIADKCGVWGAHDDESGDHPEECGCRICFTSDLNRRICEAVSNDIKLGLSGLSQKLRVINR